MFARRRTAHRSHRATLIFVLCACAARQPSEIYSEPPAPRAEVAASRPGVIWVSGHWTRDGGTWRWVAGHYERTRPGFAYVPGRWQQVGDYYVWIAGEWKPLVAQQR